MAERFQQEIEEILEQSEALPPPSKPKRSRNRDSSGSRSISPGRIVVTGIVILLVVALVVSFTPLDVPGMFFVGSALALGVVWYLFVLARADRAANMPHWRGQPVEYDSPPSGTSFWDKLTGWLRK